MRETQEAAFFYEGIRKLQVRAVESGVMAMQAYSRTHMWVPRSVAVPKQEFRLSST